MTQIVVLTFLTVTYKTFHCEVGTDWETTAKQRGRPQKGENVTSNGETNIRSFRFLPNELFVSLSHKNDETAVRHEESRYPSHERLVRTLPCNKMAEDYDAS